MATRQKDYEPRSRTQRRLDFLGEYRQEIEEAGIAWSGPNVAKYLTDRHYKDTYRAMGMDAFDLQVAGLEKIICDTMYNDRLVDGSRRYLPTPYMGWLEPDKMADHSELQLQREAQAEADQLEKRVKDTIARAESIRNDVQRDLNDPALGPRLRKLAEEHPDVLQFPTVSLSNVVLHPILELGAGEAGQEENTDGNE